MGTRDAMVVYLMEKAEAAFDTVPDATRLERLSAAANVFDRHLRSVLDASPSADARRHNANQLVKVIEGFRLLLLDPGESPSRKIH